MTTDPARAHFNQTLLKAQRYRDLPLLVLQVVKAHKTPWKPGKGCAGCLKA